MIIGMRSIDFKENHNVVDSADTRILTGDIIGELYFPIGGYFYISKNLQKYCILEKLGPNIIERYLVGPKNYFSNKQYNKDRLLCQVLVKMYIPELVDATTYSPSGVISIVDKEGIANAYAMYNDITVNPEFMSTYFYKSVKAECEENSPIRQCLEDAEHCNACVEDRFNWKLAPYLNYSSEFLPQINPGTIINILENDYGSVQRGQLSNYFIQGTMQDYFIPKNSAMFPSRLSTLFFINKAINDVEIKSWIDEKTRPQLLSPLDNTLNDKLEFIMVEHLNEYWMQLIDVCSNMVFNDLIFKYISLKCIPEVRTNRYNMPIKVFHLSDCMRDITDIIVDKLFPNINEFEFIKTQDNFIYIKIKKYVYCVDIVAASLVSLALTM